MDVEKLGVIKIIGESKNVSSMNIYRSLYELIINNNILNEMNRNF